MKKIIKTIMMAVACGGFFPAAATAQSYQLVTSTSDLESGKRYLIVAESGSTYYAWSGFYTDMGSGTATTISVSNGTITSAGKAAPMQLVQSGEMWKIIDSSTEKYVGLLSSTVNQLQESSELNSDLYLWYIDNSETSGELKVYQKHNDKSKYLKFNHDNITGSIFSIYDQSGGTDISLYKEVLNPGSPLTLYDGIDNTAIIGEAATIGGQFDVTLRNRKLYKDGSWNTLCLPFNYDKTGRLAGATIMELDVDGYYDSSNNRYEQAADGCRQTGFDSSDGTLYLFFKSAESIEAGKPYIIKWDNATGVTDELTFDDVAITSTTSVGVTSTDGYVTFKGVYSPTDIYTAEKSTLFLGGGNTLYYPWADDMTSYNLNSFRAYFQLNGITTGDPASPEPGTGNGIRAFMLNLAEGETTEITTMRFVEDQLTAKGGNLTNYTNPNATWFTLDGRRLDGKPKKKGLYIHGGRKVVIP